MTTHQEGRRQVLFVDDDPRFLEMIRNIMGAFSQGQWEIHTAENASHALALLREQTVHLVVLDVQMPVVDGLQLLTLLNRRYPNLQKVVLTGFATEPYRVACLSNGAELFLEKPRTRAQQESLFATLNELMRFRPEEGFRGVLRRIGLQDIIQMECLGASSGVLQIKAQSASGRIWIQDGAIVHAEAPGLEGEAAFNFLLTLKGGEFSLSPFETPARRTIEGQWEFLLMEAARKQDEGADLPTVAPPETAGDTPLPLAAPTPGAPAAEGAPESHGPPVRPGPRRVLDEILVCSAYGDVLHEWQVRNSELWVNFFEFLSQKARRLGQGLPLGKFDRLEAAEGDHQLVALIRDDSGTLVRSHTEGGAM